jgi:hypothetical protein
LVIVSFFRYCLWILGDAVTLLKSNTVWKKLVIDAKQRGCFYDVNEDKNLAQAITSALVELEQLDILLNNRLSAVQRGYMEGACNVLVVLCLFDVVKHLVCL